MRRQKTQHRRDSIVRIYYGLIIGGTVGVFTMALCIATGQADKRENCTDLDR
ncbi:DUF3789 domain-containing protein [Ruminococcus bicirculans (ex Wegman et al. 2014)]|uniref:DUF3789 domain-containing protein n=1 Tax=Ruminococcus bicirculans (ex Wegman et al. 2014) TaxID=1160721 RepID=UPI003FD827BF